MPTTIADLHDLADELDVDALELVDDDEPCDCDDAAEVRGRTVDGVLRCSDCGGVL